MNKIARKDEDPIVRHARRELRLSRMFSEEAGVIGKGTLAAIKTMTRYSRGDVDSLDAMVMAFNELVRGELLSPPSDDPNEWRELKGAVPMVWQNKRSPFFRSKDAGKTWFHMKEQDVSHASMNHLTGEVPEDAPIQENTNGEPSGESAQGSAESAGTDSSSAGVPGQRIDAGVATQSTEDPESPETDTDQPAPRETA